MASKSLSWPSQWQTGHQADRMNILFKILIVAVPNLWVTTFLGGVAYQDIWHIRYLRDDS